jgi:hypothetical protein
MALPGLSLAMPSSATSGDIGGFSGSQKGAQDLTSGGNRGLTLNFAGEGARQSVPDINGPAQVLGGSWVWLAGAALVIVGLWWFFKRR